MMSLDRRFLSYITSPPNAFSAVKLSSSATPSPSVTLAGWRTLPANNSLLLSSHNPSFSVEASLASPEDYAADMQELCSELPLHKVELLSLACQLAAAADADTMSGYARLLEFFPAVARIELDSECASTDAQGVLDALLVTTRDASDDTHPLCPALREMHVEGYPTLTADEGDYFDHPIYGIAYFAERRLRLDRRLPKSAKVTDLGRGLVCTFKYGS